MRSGSARTPTWQPALTYVVVLSVLGLTVMVWAFVVWPRPWSMLAHDVLLRDARPSPWPSPPSPEAVAGCYELEFTGCALPVAVGQACLGQLPREVELTLIPVRALGDGSYAVVVKGRGSMRASGWQITEACTVSVALGDGLSGATLELGAGGDGLRGLANSWSDVPRAGQWAKVHARRKACAVGSE